MDPGVKVYTAVWCTAWRALERQLTDVVDQLTLIDVDENPAEADRAQIAVVPTVIAKLSDGREIRRSGAVSADELRNLVDRVRGK